MGINTAFDVNRVTNLENRLDTDEAIAITNNDLSRQNLPYLNITGTNNSFISTLAAGNTIWWGIMEDAATYDLAIGRFSSANLSIDIRSYKDVLNFMTGRSGTATNADMNFQTNNANVAGISSNINFNPSRTQGGKIYANSDFYIQPLNTTTQFIFNAVTNGGINFGSSKLKLMADGTSIQARNEADTAYIPLFASAFTVNSEKASKEEIRPFEARALDKINGTQVKKYKLKKGVENRQEIGLIKEEAPEEIVSGDGINLYNMVSMLWKAVQELNQELQQLKGVTP